MLPEPCFYRTPQFRNQTVLRGPNSLRVKVMPSKVVEKVF